MNVLNREKQTIVLNLLLEGNSIRAIERMTNVHKITIASLLKRVGQACEEYHQKHIKGLNCTHIQCDEVWSFCYAKEYNKEKGMTKDAGDVWTWTAIDADSRFMVSWHTGKRNLKDARQFFEDLSYRVDGKVKIAADGHPPYIKAIKESFGDRASFGQVVKLYDVGKNKRKYVGKIKKESVIGEMDDSEIDTTKVERANLTMRTHLKRMNRKTPAFSKKLENHKAAIAMHFMYYNFCKIHNALKVTPAMEVGMSESIWPVDKLLEI